MVTVGGLAAQTSQTATNTITTADPSRSINGNNSRVVFLGTAYNVTCGANRMDGSGRAHSKIS